jgi:Family of unknown function (DUF6281)
MRRTLVLATLAAAFAGTAVRPEPAAASCALVVVWHDTAYVAYGPARPAPAAGARLRGAVEPGCNDTGGDPGPPTPIGVRAIAGVPPQVALMWQKEILVPPGVFPQVRGFPVAWRRVDDETRSCHVRTGVTLTGPATPAPGGIELAVRRGVDVLVDVHTRIEGLVRNGLPYIGVGQRVQVEAVRCGRKTVARRITRAGRIAAPTTAEDILGPNWRGGSGIATQARGWRGLVAAGVVGAAAAVWLIVRTRRRRSRPRTQGNLTG